MPLSKRSSSTVLPLPIFRPEPEVQLPGWQRDAYKDVDDVKALANDVQRRHKLADLVRERANLCHVNDVRVPLNKLLDLQTGVSTDEEGDKTIEIDLELLCVDPDNPESEPVYAAVREIFETYHRRKRKITYLNMDESARDLPGLLAEEEARLENIEAAIAEINAWFVANGRADLAEDNDEYDYDDGDD